jgi:uncharacterized protein YkwD
MMNRTITTIAMSAVLGLGVGVAPAHADPSYEQQVIDLTNQHRAANGCGALAPNGALTNAARGHSNDMAATNQMTHIGTNGSDAGDRITQAGYPANRWAENVAFGQTTPREVVDAWMNSPSHRTNILDCRLVDIGVGHVVNSGGVPYWTQDFGAHG